MVVMRRLLFTRTHVALLSSWVSNSSTNPVTPFCFKQCSTSTPNPETTNFPSAENGGKCAQKMENERFQNHRKVLELSRNVVVLTCESSDESGVCDVYLVGTCHISQKSCEEVRAIINFLKPEVVFLELCSSRKAILKTHDLKIPTLGEMIDAILKKKHNMLGVLTSLIYAQIASELKVIPGSEFRVAYEEAVKYGGRVELGDRPAQITLSRAWGRMSLWQKTKLVFCLFGIDSSSSLERKGMDRDIDMDTVSLIIQELGKKFPILIETLVHERDLYMSSTLLDVANKSSCVVAVVGKGHLQGIKKHWKQPVEVKDLLTIPPPKPAMSAISPTSFGVAVAGVAIIWGIYLLS